MVDFYGNSQIKIQKIKFTDKIKKANKRKNRQNALYVMITSVSVN
jgi:hypothetical protein